VQKIKLQPNAPDEEKSKKKERRPMALQKQQDPRNSVTHGSRTHGGVETELPDFDWVFPFDWVDFVGSL
jgi:hypothetical protein